MNWEKVVVNLRNKARVIQNRPNDPYETNRGAVTTLFAIADALEAGMEGEPVNSQILEALQGSVISRNFTVGGELNNDE